MAASPADAATGRNGIVSMTPAQALKAAAAALRAEQNLVISGKVSMKGSTVTVDVESAHKGADASGTLRSSNGAAGFAGTVKFVRTASAGYLWGGRAFWAGELAKEVSISAAERALLVSKLYNRWIKLPASAASAFTGSLGTLVEPAELAQELTTSTGTLDKGAVRTIETLRRGRTKALPISSSSGGRIWLATTGAPLPLEVTGTLASASKGQVFFAYPGKVTITAPAGAKSLAQLGLGG